MARAATILGSLCCAVILVLTGCRSSDSTATLTASPSTSTTMPAGGTPPASLPAAPVETAIPNAGVHCGTERWPVKTLSDSDTGSVDFTPVATAVCAVAIFSYSRMYSTIRPEVGHSAAPPPETA